MKKEALLGNPFIGEPRGGRLTKDNGRATSSCGPKGVVVELNREIMEEKGGKEREGGRSATNIWPTGHAWPPLNPYFHPPLHLAPIMLTPLTKSIKSKANSFHFFQSSFYLFLKK
jgi:hypothetical protein